MGNVVCRFGVLGPLVLERDGEAVPVPSGRQRTLLALLLFAAGRPLSRDRLIDELWGERPPASAVSALHVHLSKLRGRLGGLLVLEASGYSLDPSRFELDASRFDALVEQARSEPARARALLTEALALFRGDPLSDVVAEGTIGEWRRTLEEKRLQATLSRVEADLAGGAAGELVAELEALAGQHPYEERLWGQLLLALYRSGRQAEALEAYGRARRLFASELGLEPGEPLARLQQRILDRDPALAPADPVVPRPVSNLAAPPTRLVGRERELAALDELLSDPEARMVTLTGPGGVGKTRLLVELARRQEPAYGDGAVFVRLERLTDPALVAAEIATALGQRDGTDGPSADGLPAYLRERRLLIVIDNFEHLLAAAAVIAELLSIAPRLRVIASSRTPLRIRGEQVFEVEPLPLPAGESEAEIAGSPAVQLFLQGAVAADRRIEPDGAMAAAAAEICRALDGLPLAIELAASWSHALTPEQIADQLAHPLAIGEHALRDLPDRQLTLEATMRWSYDLLSPAAQELLRTAAVFLGGFTIPALEAVAGRPAQAQLGELLDARLARRQLDRGRFELLVLVRAFALDELQTTAAAAVLRARHRRYFAAQAAPLSVAFGQGGAPGELAAPFVADHANLRAALLDAIDAGDEESAVALALGLRPLWIAGMLRQESQELSTRLLERFALSAGSEVPLLQAVAFLDYSPAAKAWHRRLAARAAEIGDREALATAIGNLFGLALNARDRDEMARLRPELLALIPANPGTRALGWIHYYLALDAYVDGRLDTACEHAAHSSAKAQEIGHEFMLASAAATRLLAASERDGSIARDELAVTLELMRRPSVQPLAAFALWLVARYAAGVAPEMAARWLAHAERIVAALGSELWPESVLREETMAILGIEDPSRLPAGAPSLEHAAALAEAAAWLAGRDPGETAARAAREATAATGR